jgi:WD40 repeat protein
MVHSNIRLADEPVNCSVFCRFGGASDDFVLSGSDDSRAYIYSAHTGKLITKLTGHGEIVNVSIMHPFLPVVATSGIDSEIRLWKYERVGQKADEEAHDSSGSHSDSGSGSGSGSDSDSGSDS